MTKTKNLDGNYPGLNGLSYAIGYLEHLLAIVSEPLLIGCASLAVIDFITAGTLLRVPAIMYLWAGSLAVAVSATFIVTWRKCLRAFAVNDYGAGIGLAILGLVLGAVDWAAIDVQSLMQTMGISFLAALAQLNLNIIILTHLRSAVAISMAVVVAISNHTAVTQAQRPARRLLLVERILDRIAPVVQDELKDEPNVTNGHIPILLPGSERSEPVSPLIASKEAEIKALLERNGMVSDEELARLAHCTLKTARKWAIKYRATTV